jgi:hypothetical protein
MGKVKAIPLTARGRLQCWVTSLFSHFLDNRFIDGGEVVSLKCRPPFTSREIPANHFCFRLSRLQGHSTAGRIRSIEKSNNLIGNRTRDLLVGNIVPQTSTLPRAVAIRVTKTGN